MSFHCRLLGGIGQEFLRQALGEGPALLRHLHELHDDGGMAFDVGERQRQGHGAQHEEPRQAVRAISRTWEW